MPDYKLKIIIEGEDKASGPIKNVQGALGSLGNIAGGVAIGNLLSDGVKGLAGMAKGALDSYAAYERLGQSINALTAKQAILSGQATNMAQALGQTKEQSKELLDWIQKLAIESPFYQEDVAQAFRMAMALGFNTREAQRLTTAMVDFTVATGQGGETVDRISRALGQMRTKGKVSMEEINQLTEAGVDVMRILQQATGKTGAALSKDITAGAVDVNMAIDAILSDTERLYSGAAKASATSMAGVLSTLDEARGIIGRELFTGVFEQLQGPLSALTTIVTAPEFKAGLQGWSDALGAFTGDQIQGAADAMERIGGVITPLLNAQAPPWMVALGVLAGAGSTDVTVNPVLPEGYQPLEVPTNAAAKPTLIDGFGLLDVPTNALVTKAHADSEKDYGVTIVSTGKVTDAYVDLQNGETGEGGKFRLNSIAGITAWEWNASGVGLSWDASKGFQITADLGIATVPPIEIKTNITPENQKVLDALAKAAETGGAKGFGTELANQTKAELQKEVDALTAVAGGWAATIKSNLDSEFKAWEPVVAVVGSWVGDTPAKLFEQAQAPFKEPIMLAGSWLSSTFDSLWSSVQGWFNTNPIKLFFDAQPDTNSSPENTSGNPLGVPDYGSMGWEIPGGATGFQNFKGGLAVVGEEGPELVRLPAGADVFSNPDSVKMLSAMGIPGFAGGTTQLPPGAGPIISLLGSLGLWVPQRQQQMGPKTADQARGWQDFTQKGVQAMQTAADRTGAAFEETARKVNSTFESALGNVQGLFGTSEVTAKDMELSKYGLYKPKADEWLRQLGDEVFNGVDREGVDIKDAAKRVGIDPNLPKELIYNVVKQAWTDSSLFADSQNLDLINTDAVKASLEQQQKEMQGQANLKMLFGINDENLQKQSEALGQGLASVFGGASETDAVKGAGTALFAKTMVGFTDPATAAAGVKNMADSIITATGTPENQAALYDAGGAGYDTYYHGWVAKANGAPIVPPGGGSGTTPPGGTPPAGNALGTPFWRGGWTVAGEYGPELLNLPGGTSIYDAPTTQRARRGGGRPMVVNQTFVVNDKLMAEQAAQRAVQMIKRGGR